jgi:signal transduction histidine kinase
MFHSARIKLTSFYLLIIMLISIVFSMAFYQVATLEFEHGLSRIEHRMRNSSRYHELPPEIIEIAEELAYAKHMVALRLLYINGFILITAGLAGYFLAGKTLRPIEQTLEEQKRFVSDASHELRTPIAALTTTVEVTLRDKKLPKSTRPIFTELLERLSDLTLLTNKLLRLAKTNHVSLTSLTIVNIHDILAAVTKTIAPLAKKKSIFLKTNFVAKRHNVQGDPLSLTELFTIIVDNAINYSDKKDSITIDTNTKTNTLIITIKDTGIGIDKKDLPHIFDRFYRADTSRNKQSIDGHGLGLSVAKRIVVQHKGSIEAESTYGKGTTITICLPLVSNQQT